MMVSTKHKAVMPKFIGALFSVALFFFPFDYMIPFSSFGELSVMTNFYLFLPLMVFSFPFLIRKPDYSPIATEMKWFAFLMAFSILGSFFVNIENVAGAVLRGRSGLNKATTTTIAFAFCVGLVFLSARLSQFPDFYKRILVKPTLLSLLVVFIGATIEFLSRWLDEAGHLYALMSSIVRSVSLEPLASAERLKGVSAEPSTMAVFLGYAIVCVYIVGKLAQTRFAKTVSRSFFYLAILFFVLTAARSAYVILLGWGLFMIFVPMAIRTKERQRISSFSFSWTFLFLFSFGLLFFLSQSDDIAEHIIHETANSYSNLSRYASNYTAFSLFSDNPFWGVGFGQYAFRAQSVMPHWAWISPEIVNWFTNANKAWPSTYSTPARLAAELGMIGVLSWYLPILFLLRRLLNVVRIERLRLGQTPALGVSLAFGMLYVLLYNLSQESFRHFEAWVILGFVSSYVGVQNPETFYGFDWQGPKQKTGSVVLRLRKVVP